MKSSESISQDKTQHLRVAVIHYWWLSNRGGESVVAAILELFPQADFFLHVYDHNLVKTTLGSSFRGNIYSSFISRLPWARKIYQKYLPLMPLALEQLNLTGYDLIISSESGPSKGVITDPHSIHICYCHSPMRYLWDMYHLYTSGFRGFAKVIFIFFSHWMRVWDRASADRVDYFIANSNFVASRIRKFYRRESEVINPPVNVSKFNPERKRSEFYLYLGQLTAYKRIDLAISAFNKNGLKLIVIGEGEEMARLKALAATNIEFLGRQEYDVVRDHLERCKALIFPGVEDFGIVPVEAMASGAPVIAYGRGGVLDTVIDGVTGIIFQEQTVDSLSLAISKIELNEVAFNPNLLHTYAKKFDKEIFKNKIYRSIQDKIKLNHNPIYSE